VLQVQPGECDKCGGAGVRGGHPLLAGCEERRRLSGQLGCTAQPAAQSLHQREMPKAVGSFVLGARSGCGHGRLEGTRRLVEMT
jgi:hypothetical protein